MLRSAVTKRKSLGLVRPDTLFGGRGILVINLGATNVPLDYMQWIGDWALLMTFDSWSTHCILSDITFQGMRFPKGQRVFGMKMFNVAFDFRHDHEMMGAKTLDTKA